MAHAPSAQPCHGLRPELGRALAPAVTPVHHGGTAACLCCAVTAHSAGGCASRFCIPGCAFGTISTLACHISGLGCVASL